MIADTAIRFVTYGILGWAGEILFTGLKSVAVERKWDAEGKSYLWMFPIYGLIVFFYEPLHDVLRNTSIVVRAVAYSLGITGIEWVSGYLIKCIIGQCPWDYANERFGINEYIRWDFFPLWAIVGIVLERVHDFLVLLTPHIRSALRVVLS